MWGNLKMGNKMVKEHTLGLMEVSMKGNSRMVYKMDKGYLLILVETNMWENGGMGNMMVKEHSLGPMEEKG